MSVPLSKRKDGQLTVITKARDLRIYTIRVCCTESNFPKRYRQCITNNIVTTANKITDLIITANEVRVENASDKTRRRTRQKAALELTSVLLDNIGTAYDVFRFKASTLECWTRQIIDIQNLLRAWIRSDAERYSNIQTTAVDCFSACRQRQQCPACVSDWS